MQKLVIYHKINEFYGLIKAFAWESRGFFYSSLIVVQHLLAKLKERMEKKNMSARSFDRILRVSRTIADLELAQTLPSPGSPDYPSSLSAAVVAPVLSHHISEAIGYRNLDRSDYGTAF